MFSRLGTVVAKGWPAWLVGWGLLLAAVWVWAPPWDSVIRPGEFDFLPGSSPSRIGSELFTKAFPDDFLGSSEVLVISRDGQKLRDADVEFVEHTLVPKLTALEGSQGNAQGKAPGNASGKATGGAGGTAAPPSLVARVHSASEQGMAPLLNSADGQATLVVVELQSDFLGYQAVPTVGKIDQIVDQLKTGHSLPDGLTIRFTGSAVVGRDISVARQQSASATEFWTITLVIALLILVYRAPLLTLVPLITLTIAFKVCLGVVAIVARRAGIGLFEGLDVYAIVLAYGVGVDYTLFLISRYREELGNGLGEKEAAVTALSKVGSAVAASAGTGILGLGMMAFASFGKFRQAGVTIAFSLLVMLCAALTLTPALLRLGGRWIFWPHIPRTATAPLGGAGRTTAEANSSQWGLFDALWKWAGALVRRRPGVVWLVAFVLMAPFAAGAVRFYDHLDYGLITQLPNNAPSVVGTDAIRAHFPVGDTGTASVLIENAKVDFSQPDGLDAIRTLAAQLEGRKDQLQIADIRDVAAPLGSSPLAEQFLSSGRMREITARAEMRRRAVERYVGQDTHVARLDVVLAVDPFARESIQTLDRLEQAVREDLPPDVQAASRIYVVGPTASIRDLKTVANHDRLLINVLVVVAVMAVLLLLRLGFGLALYLMFTVLFSYLASLGVTFAVFWGLHPASFPGLDWTVSLFLFNILVAIGIDYNIFLMSRVHEETQRHGPVDGVAEAVSRTGVIISSCGVIMAGTFCSMLIGGRLAQMYQLGFAMAFGILLDTFVVRPLLVPSFLILVRRGWAGRRRTAREEKPASGLSRPALGA